MGKINIDTCAVCLSKDVTTIMQIKDHSISGEMFNIAQCGQCGFRFTQDPPSEADCGPYYQSEDYVSHSDTSTGIIFKIYHIVRNVMLGRKYRLLESLQGEKTLLDVGSGTGYFPHFMQEKGYRVTGIEVDDKARNYSIDKFGLSVFRPDDLKNGLINETFGFITLWHVLEHLYQPDEYLQLFAKHLKSDGYLIIAVPNHLSYDAKKYQTYWAAYDVPRHLWHFHPQAIQILAERNGFEVIKKESMPFDPFYNAMLSEKYKGNRFGLLSGMFTGKIALFKGWFNVNKASSVIYVLRKKVAE